MEMPKNTLKKPIATWNCRGRLVVVENPLVMGILNLTPDSFYAGSRTALEDVVRKAGQMLAEGADILDVGGQSTRPGSDALGAEEELLRVLPAVHAIHENYPDALISIDTFHHRVAEAAVRSGASLVNDISSGGLDPDMIPAVAALGVPYIMMHMKGTPQTMQDQAVYRDLLGEVMDHFIAKREECHKAGIPDLVIDPGFGFAKTLKQNFELLANLSLFQTLGLPILAGLSRKSMVYKPLGTTSEQALNGTTVLNTVALMQGAHILRVHDVKEAKEAVTLTLALAEKEMGHGIFENSTP